MSIGPSDEHWPHAVTCHKLQAMRIGTPGKSHLFPWSVDVGSGRELPEIVGCLFFVESVFFFLNQYVDSLLFHLISASIVR